MKFYYFVGIMPKPPSPQLWGSIDFLPPNPQLWGSIDFLPPSPQFWGSIDFSPPSPQLWGSKDLNFLNFEGDETSTLPGLENPIIQSPPGLGDLGGHRGFRNISKETTVFQAPQPPTLGEHELRVPQLWRSIDSKSPKLGGFRGLGI